MNNCKICDSELINKEQVLRARMKNVNGKPVGDRVVYKAWCSNCEIYLRKTVRGGQGDDWKTSHVQLDELDRELSEAEIHKLKAEIEQKTEKKDIFKRKKKWKEFISMMKESDKLYRYIQHDSPYLIKGYVIKRKSFLIGFFVHEIKNNATK